MRTFALGLLLVIAAPSAMPTAQRQAEPATRRIAGQVRSDDDSGTLLRRVRVTVQGAEAAAAFTDREGRFAIAVPAAGSFTLRLTKAGFAPQQIPSARIRPDDPLDVRLARGAAIVVCVVDENGAPMIDAAVRVRTAPGVVTEFPVNAAAQSDDRGEFRLGSLPAGRYVVSAPAPRTAFVGAGGGNVGVVRSSPPATVTVDVRRADEVDVTLVQEGPAAVQSAAAYSAGFTAGSDAARAKQTTTRDAPGTAALGGRVTGPAGHAIAGAIVRLTPMTPGTRAARVAGTNGRGEYQFIDVAAGGYRVSATKTGYNAGEYGQTRLTQPGMVITLRDRQRLDGVDVSLPRGSVISGAVYDADGEPMEGLGMLVWRLHRRGDHQVAEAVSGIPNRRTDDRGRYRIFGLPPGSYYVVAADDRDSVVAPGIIYDLPGVRRSYYPGSATLSQASVVRVDVGVDAPGADMTFWPADSFRVRGVAIDARGQPLRSPVALAVSARSGEVMMPAQVVSSGADGAFEFAHVPPGDYVIQAAVRPAEFGLARVTVSGGDVGPVRIQTSPTPALAGRIVLKGEPGTLLPESFLVTLAHADADYKAVSNLRMTPTVRFNPDWSFVARGMAGPMRILSPSPPRGWWLESAYIGGINAADEPVRFATSDASHAGVEVVFADTAAEIAGRALDTRGDPVAAYVAVAFPVDRERWYPGSRYIKTALPDDESRFTLASLPPGDYWVAAVDALPDGGLQDADVLTQLSVLGRRVTVSASQRLVTDVPLVRLPAILR